MNSRLQINRQPDLELEIDNTLARYRCPFVYSYMSLLSEAVEKLNSNTASSNQQKYIIKELSHLLSRYSVNIENLSTTDFNQPQKQHIDYIKNISAELHNKYVGKRVGLQEILTELNRLVETATDTSDLLNLIVNHHWLCKRFPNHLINNNNLTLLTFPPIRSINITVIYNVGHFEVNSKLEDVYLLVADKNTTQEHIKCWADSVNVKGVFNQGEFIAINRINMIENTRRSLIELQKAYLEFSKQKGLDLSFQIDQIDNYMYRLHIISDYLDKHIYTLGPTDLKLVKNETSIIRRSLISSEPEYRDYLSLLKSIRGCNAQAVNQLRLAMNNLDASLHFDENLMFCLEQIKQNSTLYLISNNKTKSIDNALGEENLSAIVATTLRGIYLQQKHLSIRTEQYIGQGRSDISIYSHNSVVGHIEFKLVKQRDDIKVKASEGLNQLFARYSENDGLANREHLALYLVLFTHDKSFNNLASKIQQATENYAKAYEHNSELDYQALDSNQSENRFCFTLTEQRSQFSFANKTRLVHVVLCNLEVDHQSKSRDRQQRVRKGKG